MEICEQALGQALGREEHLPACGMINNWHDIAD
jgi:hypothetical protein